MNSAGKQQADARLQQAYSLYYLPLMKYCNARKGSAPLSAEDCVQEAFLVYYNKLLYGEDIQNPRAFLYRTTNNFLHRALDRFKQEQSRTVPLETAAEVAAAELPFDACDLDYDLLSGVLLSSLTEEEQRFYTLKYIEHRSLAEIGEIFGISPAAAAQRSSRLRKCIQEKLTETIQTFRKGGICVGNLDHP